MLDGNCTFNVLVYADADSDVPLEWGDSDAKEVKNAEKVMLRSFSTNSHRIDTLVSYRYVLSVPSYYPLTELLTKYCLRSESKHALHAKFRTFGKMMAFGSLEYRGRLSGLLLAVMRRVYQVLQGHKLLVLHETLLSCREWGVRPTNLIISLHISDTFNVFLAVTPHRFAVSMHS